MPLSELDYIKRGVYFSHSAVSQLGLSFNDVQRCHERFTKPVKSKHQTYFGWSVNNRHIEKLDDIIPLLVSGHERHHYTQLMSTPCGILIWRIYNYITAGLSFIVRKLSDSDAKSTCYLPLTNWYYSIGWKALADNPPPPPKQLIETYGIDTAKYKENIAHYIGLVFREISFLEEFQNALQGRSELSMRQFVDLANLTFRFLAVRSGLNTDVEWTAHNLNAPSYLPNEGFSLIEIVEAAARFWELGVLFMFQASKDIISEWKNRSIFGVYKPAYEYLYYELNEPKLAQLAIDISLMTPIDLSCSLALSGKIYVEDVLPSWRLPRIVGAIKNAFWTNDRTEQELEARRNIALRAGIPTPEQTINAILSQPLNGEQTWSADIELYGVPDELTMVEYLLYIEDEVKRAIRIRQSDSLEFIYPIERPDVFQPALELYEDKAFFHGSPITKRTPLLHLKAYRNIIVNLALLALISDGDVSDLPRLQNSFTNRMALDGDISKLQDLWDAKSLLDSALDPTIFRLLRW